MRSKLEALFDDETFGNDVMTFDNGIMVNEHNDMIDFLILEYEGLVEVYLNLFDEGEAPYRNILAEGVAQTVEEAKVIAIQNLNQMAYKNLN